MMSGTDPGRGPHGLRRHLFLVDLGEAEHAALAFAISPELGLAQSMLGEFERLRTALAILP